MSKFFSTPIELGNRSSHIVPEITQDDSDRLDDLIKPFPELKARHEFFSQSKQAQNLRYLCSLVLREMMTLYFIREDDPRRYEVLKKAIKATNTTFQHFDNYGLSSSSLNQAIDTEDPLAVAKHASGQLLSLRQEVQLDEPINFIVSHRASKLLGLPFTTEYSQKDVKSNSSHGTPRSWAA